MATSEPAPTETPEGTGTQEVFGPYLVHERVGVGGMATVHRARERGIEGFERTVALKRLLPHLAEDATFVKAFVREAKLASMLQHANIVQLFELGRVGTVYFISMEYIDGRDVRTMLRQARRAAGPPTINVTVALLIQLCDALEYAHTRIDDRGEPLGLVHRDVSPSNLLVNRSGHLKVIDFGIAKAQSSQLRTQTGRVKGKLAYMAPEAIAGKELDARSDLFSVGVIAHELLTARPLFASKNEYQTIVNVQKADILPPSAFNQAVPPELDHIVLRALARDRDHRYESAAQMRDDLHAIRIQYHLSATNREVQSWIDWAFSLDNPGSSFGNLTDSFGTMSSKSPVAAAPLPLKAPVEGVRTSVATLAAGAVAHGRPRSGQPEDDEAADVAWGGGKEQDSGGLPVVLDEVPDHTHRRPTFTAAQLEETALDDAPTPLPPPPSIPALQAAADTKPTAWPHGSSPDAITGKVRATGKFASAPTPTGRASSATDPGRPPIATALDASAGVTVPSMKVALDGPDFGASIVDRRKSPAGWLLGGLAVAAAGVAGWYFLGRDHGKPAAARPPVVAPAAPATLKFIVEPADATIKIAGMEPHQGAPWSIQLDPGVAQVKISRDGHLSWETSIELSSNETQTVRVVLGQAPAGADAALANLELSSEPTGLAVLIDGHDSGKRTPLTMTLPPGPHTLGLRQAGEVVWKHSFDAEAGTLYQFNPSMTQAKVAERAARERATSDHERAQPAPRGSSGPTPTELLAMRPSTPPAGGPGGGSAVISSGSAAVSSGSAAVSSGSAAVSSGSAATTTSPAITGSAPGSAAAATATTAAATTTGPATTATTGPGSAVRPAAGSTPPVAGSSAGSQQVTQPAVTTTTTTATTARPVAPSTIPIVPPNAVKRISGAFPQITTILRNGQELPKSVTVKLCIDRNGAVTSVNLLTKINPEVGAKLTEAMRAWRYSPYQADGKPSGACFVNAFSLK